MHEHLGGIATGPPSWLWPVLAALLVVVPTLVVGTSGWRSAPGRIRRSRLLGLGAGAAVGVLAVLLRSHLPAWALGKALTPPPAAAPL